MGDGRYAIDTEGHGFHWRLAPVQVDVIDIIVASNLYEQSTTRQELQGENTEYIDACVLANITDLNSAYIVLTIQVRCQKNHGHSKATQNTR